MTDCINISDLFSIDYSKCVRTQWQRRLRVCMRVRNRAMCELQRGRACCSELLLWYLSVALIVRLLSYLLSKCVLRLRCLGRWSKVWIRKADFRDQPQLGKTNNNKSSAFSLKANSRYFACSSTHQLHTLWAHVVSIIGYWNTVIVFLGSKRNE